MKRARTSSAAAPRPAAQRPAQRAGSKREPDEHGVYDLPSRVLVSSDSSVRALITAGQVGSTFAGSVIDNPVFAICLNSGIAQGDGQANRDRRTIQMRALSLKVNITDNTSPAAGTPFICKMYLYYFKRQNSAEIPGGNVVAQELLASYPNDQAAPISHSNLNAAKDFQLLKTWTRVYEKNGDVFEHNTIEDYINLNGRETSWNRGDSTGNYDGMDHGALVLMVSAAQPGTAFTGTGHQMVLATKAVAPIFEVSSRLYFKP